MSARAKLVTRIADTLAREMSAQTTEAYLRAGADVYELLLEYERCHSTEQGGEQTLWLKLGRARTAQSHDTYRFDVRLPARLPGWVDVEPCPREHLAVMRSAGQILCDHAEHAVDDLEHEGIERVDAVGPVRAALAESRSAAEPGFDPWCLTDPDSRGLWQRYVQARRAVESLWRSDPNPESIRELYVGEFHITDEVDYCNPRT